MYPTLLRLELCYFTYHLLCLGYAYNHLDILSVSSNKGSFTVEKVKASKRSAYRCLKIVYYAKNRRNNLD